MKAHDSDSPSNALQGVLDGTLEHALDKTLGRDFFRLTRRLSQLKKRVRQSDTKSGPSSKLQVEAEKLDRAIKRSVETRQQREQQRFHLHYPESLPVAQQRDELKRLIADHQVVIVAGETGSGKTTQLPKVLLELGYGRRGYIGHTQPRRIAARNVAARLSEELQSDIGQCVGYKVRFNDQVGDTSLVKLMTDGMLLTEMEHDRYLNAYDALIIDEAHERSLNIDFILGYLKRILNKRRDLKIVIMSATIDHLRFSQHFDDAPVAEISGRSYPVDVHYRPPEEGEDGKDEVNAAVVIDVLQEIIDAHRSEVAVRPSGVLVFVSGERVIRELSQMIRRRLPSLEVLPLYARLSVSDQQRVFQNSKKMRVVISTNVAETSLTVPGIGYVIDTGLARISRYSVRSKFQRLPIEPVSKASADQRKGRCGRIAPGVCYRLYSAEDFDARPEHTEPELLRTDLAAVILKMLSLDLGDVLAFPFVEAPDPRMVNDGYRLLATLGAVDENRQLTSMGRELARLPIDPKLGRMLIEAKQQQCLNEVAIIASALSVADPWLRPYEQRQKADEAHKVFKDSESDFLTYVKLWNLVEEHRQDLSNSAYKKWLDRHFLSFLRLREWRDVHTQVKQSVLAMNAKFNQQAAEPEQVHKALLAGLLDNAVQREDIGVQKKPQQAAASSGTDQTKGRRKKMINYVGTRNRVLRLFPGSVLAKQTRDWLVAAEVVETEQVYARTLGVIDPRWIEELATEGLKRQYSEPHWSRKRGAVMAYEQVRFNGLVIVAKRRIQFSTIDPVLCRELFIRHALVMGEYECRSSKADFLKHNRALVDDVEYLEDKTRRRDLLVDDTALEAFYAERLPETIVSARHFEKWLKSCKESSQLDALKMKPQDVRQQADDESHQHLYPDQKPLQSDFAAKLSYVFEPGRADDGVSFEVPLTTLHTLDVATLDWLVPGLLRDKCIALLKALPKSLRKQLVPIPDHVDAFLASKPDQQQSLTAALSRYLQQSKGVLIKAQDWPIDKLDPHLSANVKVLDDNGKCMAEGRDLIALQERLQQQVEAQLAHADDGEWERTGIVKWDFGAIPESVSVERNGLAVQAYPALTMMADEVDALGLRLFSSRISAVQSHGPALVALLRLQLPSEIKYLRQQLQKALKAKTSSSLSLANISSVPEFVDDVIAASLKECGLVEGLVWNVSDFQSRLDSVKRHLVGVAQSIFDLALDALSQRHRIRCTLKDTANPAREPVYADIQQQLRSLFEDGWLRATPYTIMKQLPRYLKAIDKRIERLQGHLNQDLKSVERLQPLYEQYASGLDDAQRQQDQQDPQGFRWMLEELRVSLFAQELKTAYPISEKRLQKKWQAIIDNL